MTPLRKAPLVFLFTNARNEKHIKEWAAHHLLIGFSCIYIFDHKSVVPLKSVFNNFDKRVIVERCELENPVKILLMNRAANIAKKLRADWMIYLDADEFIVLNKFMGVKRMLSHFPYADSVALNWLMFGTNHHIKDPNGLILNNYTKSDSKLNKHVKTFVRPYQIMKAVNPHYYQMRIPSRMYSISGNPINQTSPCFYPWPIEYSNASAFIAHYVNQSEETYIRRKIKLPSDDTNSFRKKDDNIHSKHNEVHNHLLKSKYANIVSAFLQKFL